jgi:hypothetical protein
MTKLIEKLEHIGFDEDQVTLLEDVCYEDKVNITDDIIVEYVEGYRGEEDGGTGINFLIKVYSLSNVFEEFYVNVTGYYSSWDESSWDWEDAEIVTVKEKETQMMERMVYSNGYTSEWVKA